MIPWWTFPFAFGATFVAFWGSIGIGFGLAALPLDNDLRGALAVSSGIVMALVVLGLLWKLRP